MFYYLSGELAYKDLNTCVIDCGGVGYKLTVSQITSQSLTAGLGKKVKLFTHLAVREDGIELFGFGNELERSCFNNLTTVSGVGPKAAISILSVMTPEDLSVAICQDDRKAIARAPGIGPKTAARIILELKDKMAKEIAVPDAVTLGSGSVVQATKKSLQDAYEALVMLGYDKSTVSAALKGLEAPTDDAGEIIRLALKKLSR